MITLLSGAGNQFVFSSEVVLSKDVPRICQHFDVDGLIFLTPHDKVDYAMHYFNRDGSPAGLCGNGLRCSMAYLQEIGCEDLSYQIFLGGQTYTVSCEKNGLFSVSYPCPDLSAVRKLTIAGCTGFYLNIGNPHFIIFLDKISTLPVNELGKQIRESTELQPTGANVSFVCFTTKHQGNIRTYEIGVEEETGACGSGALAATTIGNMLNLCSLPTTLITSSGHKLSHTYGASGQNHIKQIGPVERPLFTCT
jgi:diaminopimelate epimerase